MARPRAAKEDLAERNRTAVALPHPSPPTVLERTDLAKIV